MLALHSSVVCFLIILFSWTAISASEDHPVVNTSSGPVKGKRITVGSGSVAAYLGIPYAEPPLGKLRFMKPLPHQPWSQVLEVTDFGNACPQAATTGIPDADQWTFNRPLSEDCLFLNIWAPHPQPSTQTPILVFIHGGGYLAGTSSLDVYNAASLVAAENVIVASMNYRLGALGFLYLPPAVPGNMGLWDQQLALSWVKENAAAFGGDPNRVTLFGQSAGGAAVGFHLLSPSSQPLFARAVVQSGSPNAFWASSNPEEAKQKYLHFSQELGCKEVNETEIVTCLQGKDMTIFPQHITSRIEKMKHPMDLPFLPTTDGEFLPDEPQKLLEMLHVQIKPTLVGFASDEGSLFALIITAWTNNSLTSWEQFIQAVKIGLHDVSDDVVQTIAQKYTEGIHNPASYRLALSQILGDYLFVCPAAKFAAKSREAGSPVYTYSFTHHTSGSVWPEWAGAPHGAEIPYLFGTLDLALAVNQTYTEAEAALSRTMMKHWAEFARTGNPTGSETSEVVWPLYNATKQNFFGFGAESSKILQVSPAQHCDLFERSTNSKKSEREENGESNAQYQER